MKKYYKGMIEVESCPACRGIWLDSRELDQLEDMVFENDSQKGSLVHFQFKTNHPCPRCGNGLDEFQYRLYDLKLDYCDGNDHGYWLDAGEDERVMEIMRQRARDMQRKTDAESMWKQTIKEMHHFLRKRK